MNLTFAITKGNKVLLVVSTITLLLTFYQIYAGIGFFIQWFIMIICSTVQIVIAMKTIKDAQTGIFNNTN